MTPETRYRSRGDQDTSPVPKGHRPFDPAEQARVDARLPARFQGRGRGYRRMLETVPLRIGISGIRGKSSLTRLVERHLRRRGHVTYAKRTGTDPVSMKMGVEHPIDRGDRSVMLDETMWELKRFYPYTAAVVENQAISEYTMRIFNRQFLRPTHILITNVRRDHQGTIASSLPDLARAFGRSIHPGATVISGEQDPDLNAVLKEEVRATGGTFLAARIPEDAYVPGLENVAILHRFLVDATGRGLTLGDWASEADGLRAHFRWRVSSRDGLSWFPGADVNDVDSTRAILDHLTRDDPGPVTLVAYFRADRRDRTASFVPFLRWALSEDRADHVVVAGPGAGKVARALDAAGHGDRVHRVPDDPDRAGDIVDRVADLSTRGRVMTVANAVPPFPRQVAEELSVDDDPSDRPDPAAFVEVPR